MTIDEAIAHAQETADTRTDLCDECRKEHRQLAEWLTELKQLRDSFEKQRSINYELVDENQELINENKELKRLLRLAVEDLSGIDGVCDDYDDVCDECPCKINILGGCKWKHADEAMQLLGDDADD